MTTSGGIDPNLRKAWLADAATILGIAEANPGLPLPHISPRGIDFRVDDISCDAPRLLAAAEATLAAALGVTFTPRPESSISACCGEFILAATLGSGTLVEIRAWGPAVARRHVRTAPAEVHVVGWDRLPVPGRQATLTAGTPVPAAR